MSENKSEIAVQKHGKEKIVLQVSNFKGKKYIDIRTQFLDSDGDGWIPTKKGITLNVNLSPELLIAFLELMNEIDWKNLPIDYKLIGGERAREIAKENGIDVEDGYQTVLIINDITMIE